MARRRRGYGLGRIFYGVSALGAGASKIAHGGAEVYSAMRGFRQKPPKVNPWKAGKGFEKMYSGVRVARSGFRSVRAGARSAGGTVGHPFYGNQYSRVTRYSAMGSSMQRDRQRGYGRSYGRSYTRSRGRLRGRGRR